MTFLNGTPVSTETLHHALWSLATATVLASQTECHRLMANIVSKSTALSMGLSQHATVTQSLKAMRLTVRPTPPSYCIIADSQPEAYLCSDLQADYSVTREQLVTWNPWLDPECDTKLYAGLVGNEKRSVCIGVNATGPQDTTSKSPTSTAPQTGTVTTVAMGPTRTDIAAKCQAFYTVTSGDTCYDIETSYGITFEEFLDWNPSGKSPPFWKRFCTFTWLVRNNLNVSCFADARSKQ